MADDKGDNMTIRIDSTKVLDLLGEHGERWVKGEWGDEDGMCLHGAIRRCQPQPGDAFIVEQVADRLGWGVEFNDDDDTTWDDVRARIVAGLEVTDADLADTFGSQWEAIVALVRRAAVVTEDEAARLAAAWDAARAAAPAAVWAAARAAASAAAWVAASAAASAADRAAASVADRVGASVAVWVAARAAVWAAARDAAWNATRALAARDLIGKNGFEQAHYDTLTRPWATVIGKVHPDDAEVGA